MERRGKSSPARQVTVCKCKPYPVQHRMQTDFLSAFARRSSAGGWRQAAMLVRDRWQSRREPYRTRLTDLPIYFYCRQTNLRGDFPPCFCLAIFSHSFLNSFMPTFFLCQKESKQRKGHSRGMYPS